MTDIAKEALALYLEGLKLFGEDKYAESLARYEQALEIQPDWTEAMNAQAMAYMHHGALDEAIAIGKRICELGGEDAFAHTSLSMFYQRKGAVAERAGDAEQSKLMIELAEEEGAKARMLSWKLELETNPDAAPPGPAGSMDVVE